MQPPPPAPTPAQAPAVETPVAQSPATAASPAPATQYRVSDLPKTAQELDGLRTRREIQRDQIGRAQGRREELVQQLNRGLPEEAKVGVQQRLKLLDERILQLEQEQNLTEHQIANADPKVLAESEQQRREDRGPQMGEDEAAGIAFATFGAGVLLTMLVGRVRRRFARRRAAKLGGGAAGATAPAEDPRIERLTQAVDAIAVEVERIGEGQRFVTQLLANQRQTAALEAERR